ELDDAEDQRAADGPAESVASRGNGVRADADNRELATFQFLHIYYDIRHRTAYGDRPDLPVHRCRQIDGEVAAVGLEIGPCQDNALHLDRHPRRPPQPA